MSECSHKLCHATATLAVDVRDSGLGGVFRSPKPGVRHYELCHEHFIRYFPHGLGYIARREAVALGIQCVATESPLSEAAHARRETPSLGETVSRSSDALAAPSTSRNRDRSRSTKSSSN